MNAISNQFPKNDLSSLSSNLEAVRERKRQLEEWKRKKEEEKKSNALPIQARSASAPRFSPPSQPQSLSHSSLRSPTPTMSAKLIKNEMPLTPPMPLATPASTKVITKSMVTPPTPVLLRSAIKPPATSIHLQPSSIKPNIIHNQNANIPIKQEPIHASKPTIQVANKENVSPKTGFEHLLPSQGALPNHIARALLLAQSGDTKSAAKLLARVLDEFLEEAGKSAAYWIARARIAESNYEQEEVIRCFDLALFHKAQPSEIIAKEFQSYVIRRATPSHSEKASIVPTSIVPAAHTPYVKKEYSSCILNNSNLSDSSLEASPAPPQGLSSSALISKQRSDAEGLAPTPPTPPRTIAKPSHSSSLLEQFAREDQLLERRAKQLQASRPVTPSRAKGFALLAECATPKLRSMLGLRPALTPHHDLSSVILPSAPAIPSLPASPLPPQVSSFISIKEEHVVPLSVPVSPNPVRVLDLSAISMLEQSNNNNTKALAADDVEWGGGFDDNQHDEDEFQDCEEEEEPELQRTPLKTLMRANVKQEDEDELKLEDLIEPMHMKKDEHEADGVPDIKDVLERLGRVRLLVPKTKKDREEVASKAMVLTPVKRAVRHQDKRRSSSVADVERSLGQTVHITSNPHVVDDYDSYSSLDHKDDIVIISP